MRPSTLRLALFSFFFALPALAGEWKPVTAADLELKAPLVDKTADAEAIFWEVRVVDESQGGDLVSSRFNYIRMKIFSERGRERAKVELTYRKKMNISSVAGRTIKPDGRIVDMKRDAVFDTDVVKGKGVKVKARTFTLPDVQPGDIIEYQWKQSENDVLANYIQLPLQRDIPIQSVRYQIKPLEIPGYGMKAWSFHVKQEPFKQIAGGFTQMEYHSMPAFVEEPNMAPEDEIRAWVLIYYTDSADRKPESYWPDFGKKRFGMYQKEIKVSGEIKKAAADATGSAKTDDEKLKALYSYLRKNVKNVSSDATAEQRKSFKVNHTSADTLKQGMGTGYDLNILFAALATGAGMEARIAVTGDRGEQFFNQSLTDPWFLRDEMVAVKAGGAWKFYDPATPSLPCGELVWQQQGVMALITDPKAPEWVRVPLSKPSESTEAHTAHFKLDSDGNLSGDVKTTYTGHIARAERSELAQKTATEREQYLIEDLKVQFGNPEITAVSWENVEDAEKPLSVGFHIQVPAYVQKTGKRIFLSPAVLQHNLAARFPGSDRRYPIYFHYPWSETDEISIEVPEGYEFDHPDIPPYVKAGNTLEWKVSAQIDKGRTLIFHRNFQFGEDGNIVMPVEAYPALKKVFDAMHEGDEHTFALKQAAAK